MEGIGTLVIRLPGESGSARTLTQTEKDKYLSELKYSIECSGPVSMIKRDAGAGETVPLYLTSGKYNITVTITNKNGRVIGSETKTETIEAGEKKSVDFKIDLDEPYYFLENEYTNHLKEIAYDWTSGWHILNLEKYNYTKKIVHNNTYIFNIKGHSNTEIHDIIASLWLYTGNDLINRDHVNMHWLGNSTEESIINIDKDKDFDITFEVTVNLDTPEGLTPTAFNNYFNDPGRISLNLSKKVDAIEKQNRIMAAITHFNMTVKESLSFDMVVWSDTSESGWSSGHDRNTPIYVVPEYLPSIKSNTMYKITAKGRSNADMKEINGQFQLTGYNGATDWGATFHPKINLFKDQNFTAIFYVATNEKINRQNQRNVIFNLVSNHSDKPSAEAGGTVKATITNFSMTIEEVRSGENGLIFRLNDEGSGYIVKGSAATKGAVNIPDMWKETDKSASLPVTEIDDWAFHKTDTTSVKIGEKVEIIGEDAFSQTKLTSVTIPDSVEIIKKGAFYELHLSSVVISKNSNLRIIGEIAFVLNDFTNILIPARVERIHKSFGDCKNLTSVIIMAKTPPDLIDGDFTWLENEKLSFHVPAGSLSTYKQDPDWGYRYGVENFYAIESIVFSLSDYLANNYPNNQTVSAAFISPLFKTYGSGLVYTVDYNGIEIKGRTEGWHGLDINIDASPLFLDFNTYVYKITVSANLLSNITGTTSILVQGADSPYYQIVEHTPISTTSIIALNGEIPSDFLTGGNNKRIRICTINDRSITGIRINNIIIEKIGYTGVLGNNGLIYTYNEDYTASVRGSELTNGYVEIPAYHEGYQITKISAEAFKGNTNISGVSIPASVTSIGFGAFMNCSNLTNITLPDGLTYLGGNAFENCSKLTGNIIIPLGVEEINDWTFKNTCITKVEIQGSVKRIGQGAFSSTNTNTRELTEVIIGEGVEIIDEYAFEQQSKLISITLPASMKTIHSGAFYSCTNLSSVTILAVSPPVLMQLGKQNNGQVLSIWFYGNASNRLFYVPAGSVEAYKAASLWSSNYSDFINPIN